MDGVGFASLSLASLGDVPFVPHTWTICRSLSSPLPGLTYSRPGAEALVIWTRAVDLSTFCQSFFQAAAIQEVAIAVLDVWLAE